MKQFCIHDYAPKTWDWICYDYVGYTQEVGHKNEMKIEFYVPCLLYDTMLLIMLQNKPIKDSVLSVDVCRLWAVFLHNPFKNICTEPTYCMSVTLTFLHYSLFSTLYNRLSRI